MKRYCWNCGAELDNNVQICGNCGVRIQPAGKKCPYCGNDENEGNAVYCGKCGRKLKKGKSKMGVWIVSVILAIAVVSVVLITVLSNGRGKNIAYKEPASAEPVATEPAGEVSWKENILMSDEVANYIVYNGYGAFVMGTSVPRAQINSITFLDTLKDVPADSWDVSEKQDGSVLAWVTNGNALYIGANGGINAKYCQSLFYGYYNVSGINFNHCFHTDYATSMKSMFDYCPSLRALDVSDFKTANVTDMAGMFYQCASLTSLDLSGFDTSKVTDMGNMFAYCSGLTSLDLSSFDTSNVVNHDNFMESGKMANGHPWEEMFSLPEGADQTAAEQQIPDKRPIAVDGGEKHSVILYNDGTVITIGDDTYAQRSTSGWRDIVQISTFSNHTLGLKRDGTVVATGANKEGQCNVSGWTDIIAVTAGSRHSVGVKQNGTVVAVGSNSSGQCDVGKWQNVKSVAANATSTFGLTNDGKVLVCGSFYNQNLSNWSDIVSISVSANHVVGVHSDGTVSALGENSLGQCDAMEKWRDTQQVAAGYGFTAGLRSSGGVWVHGCDEHNEHAAMQWTDIVTIGTGIDHILGIKQDGILVAKGVNNDGQCDVYRLNET